MLGTVEGEVETTDEVAPVDGTGRNEIVTMSGVLCLPTTMTRILGVEDPSGPPWRTTCICGPLTLT